MSSSADVGAVAIPYNRFDAVPDHDNRPPTALVRQLTVRLCATDAPARHH